MSVGAVPGRRHADRVGLRRGGESRRDRAARRRCREPGCAARAAARVLRNLRGARDRQGGGARGRRRRRRSRIGWRGLRANTPSSSSAAACRSPSADPGARAQRMPRVRSRRPARGPLRQDASVRIQPRRGALRRSAHHRTRYASPWPSMRPAAGSACRCATTCASRSCTASYGDVALLLVPSAFTALTGAAHWHLLLRARAVENQCYVLAAAQGGLHANGRRTYGHSMLIDPWGDVVAELPEGPGVVVGDVLAERIADVRRELPALAHRRL